MAETPTQEDVPEDIADESEDEALAPEIGIESQYIKDLSFENPLGPNAQSAVEHNPSVSVEVSTSARPLDDTRYEVTLFVRGEAKLEDSTVFIIELTYGASITLNNVPEDAIAPILLIEGARLIFPFARNIVAEVTRDGGFPPLFINPIDFVQLYREQHIKDGEGEGDAAEPLANGDASN